MGWIETIRISVSKGAYEVEYPETLKILENQFSKMPSLEWGIYQNPTVPEDSMIMLRWETDSAAPIGSEIALTMIRELKQYGLVDHSLWMDVAKKEEK